MTASTTQESNLTTRPLAYSLKQFCDAVGISLRTFYALKQRGEAPPVVNIGRRVVVRSDAALEWLKEREQS